MQIPKLDKRSRSDIINKIKALSEVYTPEWNFDTDNQDMGSTIAEIYADMMSDIIDKYNKTAEKNMVSFFSKLEAEPLYPEPAHGYVQFEISGNEENVRGEYVDSGVKILAQGGDNSGNLVFTVTEPLYVMNFSITDIFYENTHKDVIYKRFSSQQDGKYPEKIYAFGSAGKNLQRHILYFSAEECMKISFGCEIIIEFEFDSADEYTASDFMKMASSRGQHGLYYSSGGTFRKAHNLITKGNNISFIPENSKLPEKIAVKDIERYWFRIIFNDVEAAEKIYIKNIRVGTKSDNIRPDGVYSDTAELIADSFNPFDISPVPYSSVYFSSETALCKYGAEVTLEFRIDYLRNRINDISDQEEINWKHIMKKSKIKRPKEYDVKIQSVIWEYYNGSGWVRLFKDNSFSNVFNGENDSSVVKLNFICPNDISRAFLPSGENYALRARILSVENFMKYNGFYVTPVISSPLFKYNYRSNVKSDYFITENCLETNVYHRKKHTDSIKAAYVHNNAGRCLYFGLSSPPDAAAVKILFVPEFISSIKSRSLVWKYYSSGEWKELSLYDETAGLTKTGIITFNLNKNFEKTELFERNCFWIMAELMGNDDGYENRINKICLNCTKVVNLERHDYEYFYIKPDEPQVCRLRNKNVYSAEVMVNEFSELSELQAAELVKNKKAVPVYDSSGKMYQLWVLWREIPRYKDLSHHERCYYLDRNNAEVIFSSGFTDKVLPESESENVRISYYTGGGKNGNIKEKCLTAADRSIGMISAVTNPVKTTGGFDRENISQTLERYAKKLRRFQRACTAFDYECMAMEAERGIIKVKCLSCINADGEKEYGTVTLVVLTRDCESFPELKEKIRKYILARSCGNVIGRLNIVPPVRIIYNITVLITAAEYEYINKIQTVIAKRIRSFFDPLSGGTEHNGWDIGTIPRKIMIYNLLDDTEGIERIESFYVSMHKETGDEITEAELNELISSRMSMAEIGELNISVDVKNKSSERR